MSRFGIFMADGCEEIEGLTVVDMLRRAGIEIEMISVSGQAMVNGSHGICFMVDKSKDEADYASYDGIILPGGMPGTKYLAADEKVKQVIREFAQQGKLVCAICAAPSVLGGAGVLQGKHATSYPGFAEKMPGCIYETEAVVKDGNIITSRGMGTAIPFALEIIRTVQGDEAAQKLSAGIMFS